MSTLPKEVSERLNKEFPFGVCHVDNTRPFETPDGRVESFLASELEQERKKERERAAGIVRKAAEQCHGGGNGRRLLIQAEGAILNQDESTS